MSFYSRIIDSWLVIPMFLPQRLTFFHKQLEVSSYRTVCAVPLQSTVNCLFQPLCAQKYPLISCPLSCSQSLYKTDQDISCVHQYLDQYLRIKTTDFISHVMSYMYMKNPIEWQGGWGEAASLLVKLGYGTVAPFLIWGGGGLIQTTQNFFLQQLTFLDMGFKKLNQQGS